MAWILDDYGDRETSIKFYNNRIQAEQRSIAERTRRLVNKEIGSFADIKAEQRNAGSNPKLSSYAAALPHSGIQLQWLKKSEAEKAEQAFFTINQSAVKIDATELKILDTRFKPNAIIARAIVRNATGHKYWGSFSAGSILKIEESARNINELLFTPPLSPPIKTLELPIAGHGYGSQSLPLIYELANLANGLPVEDPSKHKTKRLTKKRNSNEAIITQVAPDEKETLRLLNNTLQLARKMTGMHPSSLGLHPAVYFYSASGRHQPTAVLAMSAIVHDMKNKNSLHAFCDVRSDFEEFLLEHKDFINQITRKTGSMAKGLKLLKEYLEFVIGGLQEGLGRTEVKNNLANSDKFSFIQIPSLVFSTQVKNFSTPAKQHAFLEEALEAAITCKICDSRKDGKSMTADHMTDKRLGGAASPDNLQYVHPFCNSSYKEHKQQQTTKQKSATDPY